MRHYKQRIVKPKERTPETPSLFPTVTRKGATDALAHRVRHVLLNPNTPLNEGDDLPF